MKILFLCTAHNSLSQRLYVALAEKHNITIELAISDHIMIEAAKLFQPDLILCPFLTVAVPEQIHKQYLTLIVHPGPPGDVGPSSIDWLIIGDDGMVLDAAELLKTQSWSDSGRSHWGVTIFQAIETFDEGPVWAFEQFPVNIDTPGLTKSSLYRGLITRAALLATSAALRRIEAYAWKINPSLYLSITPAFSPRTEYKYLSITSQTQFEGGVTRVRPLLKAADRDFDIQKDPAKTISRKIRCADSQPGCLSSLFGVKLYLYGGIIENGSYVSCSTPGKIVDCRDGALLFLTSDQKAIWVTHLRRIKRKEDATMWPKVPAMSCLSSLGLMNMADLKGGTRDLVQNIPASFPYSNYREIRVESEMSHQKRIAFIYFDFYNGAMSTDQCSRLLQALISTTTKKDKPSAIVLMGSDNFFGNGIHLNVIQTATDPALETWRNINQINDLVFYLLHELPRKGIVSIAALRGNCAAGGVALAAACDHVIASVDVVLNPSYRAIGLHGSEYHTLSYRGRCGVTKATSILKSMTPLSATKAQSVGLVDHVLHMSGNDLDISVRQKSVMLLQEIVPTWKANMDLSLTNLQLAEAHELSEMAKDCWSARAERFHSRRLAFVCKFKSTTTPLRFATHRRHSGKNILLDEEEKEDFDSVEYFELRANQAVEDNACRTVMQQLMINILKLFGKSMKNEVMVGMVEERQQPQMVFPCYYQS